MTLTITKHGKEWKWELTRPGKCTISGTGRTKASATAAGQFEQRLESPRFAEKVAKQWEDQREGRERCLLGLNVY